MRVSPKLLLSLLSLAVVLFLFTLDLGRTSPGELSPVHQQVPTLQGAEGCDACHGTFGQSLREACLKCHGPIAAALESKRGLHGVQAALDCAHCHLEHHGAELELSGERAFAQAGIPDRSRYDHASLGFLLAGAHVGLACARCHLQADAAVLAAGEQRFTGLSQDCASCHKDPHEGRMRRACADCHGQSLPFTQVATFEHGAAFTGRGAHARAACLDCHPKGGPNSVESLGERESAPRTRACAECHESPHAAGFVEGAVAPMGAASADAACRVCHDPERGPFREARPLESTDWHGATGFPLEAPHQQVACAGCHGNSAQGVAVAASFGERYPGRKPDDCAACHADPHGGQFAGRAASRRGPEGKACLACHGRQQFKPSLFGAAEHAATGFVLEGAHGRAECSACHQKDPGLPGGGVRFAGTPAECGACHVDVHDGRFTGPEVRATLPDQGRGGCAACHDTRSFSGPGPLRERFDHDRSAGFPLDGAHLRIACESCHRPSATPDSGGRRFGRAAEQFGATRERLRECATCHVDVHDGAFATGPGRAVAPADLAGDPRGGACAACHTTESFRGPVARRFDHGAWTGFSLVGAHQRADCAVCHEPLQGQGPGSAARTFGRASERFPECAGRQERCEACHVDPHGGRFDRPGTPASIGGAAGCARCHTQESFAGASSAGFDHLIWTGFRLEGAHAEAACVACHAPDQQALALGKSTLGRAAGAACIDCHADPHGGQFAEGPSGTDACSRCHSSSGPFTQVTFDHQRDARFSLDATHAKVACAACHVPLTLPSGARLVRYRPLGRECADCHGFKKGG